MTTTWIGPDDSLTLGQVGFLVSRTNLRNGGSMRYELRDTPAYTNQSHEPRLEGWCGTTNDVSISALGMAKVVRIARNGRALVQHLQGPDLDAALEELGYPDL